MVSELFLAKFLEILTAGSLEISKVLQKQSVLIFRATAHALHLNNEYFRIQEKAENCWALCILAFSNISL